MLFVPLSLHRLLSRRVLTQGAIGLVASHVALALTLLALEDRLLFHPVRACRYWTDPPPGCAAQDAEFRTAEGTLIHAGGSPARRCKARS